MNNKEVNNFENPDDGLKDLIEELKNLPEMKLPPDFDGRLKTRIALDNEKKQKKITPYTSYSKYLVYSGSFIIVLCLAVLSVIIFRSGKEPVIKNAAIDSTYYHDKKVIIIPPPENLIEGSSKKTIEKITGQKDNKSDKKQIQEYFETEKSPETVSPEKFATPLSGPKTMMMSKEIKKDSSKKGDSSKKYPARKR